ncbi:MAG TPA: diguanylate cyclase, partial [Candidatus Omnitrophota bacterium]|nr:diguanylate cyclase [Candidatus Omnitrophota bacterium]
ATTGYGIQEAVGQTPRILRSGRQDAAYYQRLWETILSGKVFRATTANKKKNGQIYYADQTISPVKDETGKIVCFVSVWKDVTERIEAEEKLTYEKKKLEQVLGIEAGLHSILDLNKLIDFVVEKTCEVLEVQRCSVMFIDHESGELCIKGHRGIEESMIGESVLKIGDEIVNLIERQHKAKMHNNLSPKHSSKIDGTLYQSEAFLSVPIELKDHLLGIINVSHKKGKHGDIFTDLDFKILLMIVRQVRIAMENAKLYRELKYISMTDGLTGIYNYRYFTQTIDYEIVRAKRYGRSLSLLMIDIDQLKTYNDTIGHLEGDKLIKSIAKVIKESVRTTDVACRYAGDEFAVILPETDLGQARNTAEKIRKKVAELSARQPVSVSIGLAESTTHTNRYDLIQKADSQLYAAKHHGKNQISG